MYDIEKGEPLLGCNLLEDGANFAIFSDWTEGMILEIYEEGRYNVPLQKFILNRKQYVVENTFCIKIKGIMPKMGYVWRTMDTAGKCSKALLDPYAYAMVPLTEEEGYCNIVVKNERTQSSRPHIPWKDTVIYEMHVGHFTKHPTSGISEEERGTFKGLIRKIPYLKKLGITALELMPIFKWNPYTIRNVNPYTGEKLQDVWGYNTIGFFALDEKYTVSKNNYEGIREFKELVEEAHQNGLEIILDVVYNHSGEGGHDGKDFNFKHLGKNTYYRLDERGNYRNCSGTGNTFDANNPIVKKLIIESLRYWTTYMGVDGFRFDLASILGQDAEGRWMKQSLLNEIADDAVLSNVKLISESWDAKGSYDVGRMPYAFREWSDYFRDTMRKFIKGDQGIVKSVVDCMQGKEIYFTDPMKSNTHTIHFITAHDGFTMWDLLSYNEKHNMENGENNRDGNNANYSYNWGVEGDTDNKAILNQRKRCMKNGMCFLFMGKGVPMLLMGDEVARTQGGNNNTYCQDHAGVWMNWEFKDDFKEILSFTTRLINLRKHLTYFVEQGIRKSKVSFHGVHYRQPDWSYYSRSIAWHIENEDAEDLYMVANNYHESLVFELPITGKQWVRIVDTNLSSPEDISSVGVKISNNCYKVTAYSFCIFKESTEV